MDRRSQAIPTRSKQRRGNLPSSNDSGRPARGIDQHVAMQGFRFRPISGAGIKAGAGVTIRAAPRYEVFSKDPAMACHGEEEPAWRDLSSSGPARGVSFHHHRHANRPLGSTRRRWPRDNRAPACRIRRAPCPTDTICPRHCNIVAMRPHAGFLRQVPARQPTVSCCCACNDLRLNAPGAQTGLVSCPRRRPCK
jgi:hypothetical protein